MTRLETRTKESTKCASVTVENRNSTRNESEVLSLLKRGVPLERETSIQASTSTFLDLFERYE